MQTESSLVVSLDVGRGSDQTVIAIIEGNHPVFSDFDETKPIDELTIRHINHDDTKDRPIHHPSVNPNKQP